MTNGCSSGLYVLLIPLGGFVVLPEILGTEQILHLRNKWPMVTWVLLRALEETGVPFLPAGGPVS